MHNDRRVARTRRALYTALVELSATTAFDLVTVADIAEHAGVNRTTFYRHHRDKYAFVTEIFRQGVDSRAHPLRSGSDGEAAFQVRTVEAVFEHLAKHKLLFRALLGRRPSQWFVMWLQDYWRDHTEIHLLSGRDFAAPGPPREMVTTIAAHTMVGATTWWLEGDLPASPRSMAEWYVGFLNGCLTSCRSLATPG